MLLQFKTRTCIQTISFLKYWMKDMPKYFFKTSKKIPQICYERTIDIVTVSWKIHIKFRQTPQFLKWQINRKILQTLFYLDVHWGKIQLFQNATKKKIQNIHTTHQNSIFLINNQMPKLLQINPIQNHSTYFYITKGKP